MVHSCCCVIAGAVGTLRSESFDDAYWEVGLVALGALSLLLADRLAPALGLVMVAVQFWMLVLVVTPLVISLDWGALLLVFSPMVLVAAWSGVGLVQEVRAKAAVMGAITAMRLPSVPVHQSVWFRAAGAVAIVLAIVILHGWEHPSPRALLPVIALSVTELGCLAIGLAEVLWRGLIIQTGRVEQELVEAYGIIKHGQETQIAIERMIKGVQQFQRRQLVHEERLERARKRAVDRGEVTDLRRFAYGLEESGDDEGGSG